MKAVVAAIGALILAAACGRVGGAVMGDDDAGRHDAGTNEGGWRPITQTSAPTGRVDHTAVWSGTEMIVWGGEDDFDPHGSGSRYHPADDAWRAMTPLGAPDARDDHVAVWTGTEMLVWGGNHYDEDTELFASGGGYDPMTDRWRPMSTSVLTARDDPRAVWTGTEMIIWGGRDLAGKTGDGAGYDPVTDSWRLIAITDAPAPREDHSAVWTGNEMIVWGGWNGEDQARNHFAGGGRYDPATDSWRPISLLGAPEKREDHTALWTGSEMIIWGGVVHEGSPPLVRQLATGGRYHPATDTWTSLPSEGSPAARDEHVALWTGSEMLVWGGQGSDGWPTQTGARYRAATDDWVAMTPENVLTARSGHVAVWTGAEMIVWGGIEASGWYARSGAGWAP